ncbi:MAG: hypothetical protein JJT89_15740 [Nitriliruptoraceae bacterium]|nr:hypothetical protein [Nitriliruptoraceae bacterium]
MARSKRSSAAPAARRAPGQKKGRPTPGRRDRAAAARARAKRRQRLQVVWIVGLTVGFIGLITLVVWLTT